MTDKYEKRCIKGTYKETHKKRHVYIPKRHLYRLLPTGNPQKEPKPPIWAHDMAVIYTFNICMPRFFHIPSL